MGKLTYEQFKNIFKKNADGSYVDLKFIDMHSGELVNLSGKKIEDYTMDEIILLKKFAGEISKNVDVDTID